MKMNMRTSCMSFTNRSVKGNRFDQMSSSGINGIQYSESGALRFPFSCEGNECLNGSGGLLVVNYQRSNSIDEHDSSMTHGDHPNPR